MVWQSITAPWYTFSQISVEPVFGWLAVLPLAILMVASLWLILSTQELSWRGKTTLLWLRAIAATVLVLGWLRPGIVHHSEHSNPGAIAVLLDTSLSMSLPSESPNKSRWDVQIDIWNALVSATNLELGNNRLVPYFFDRNLHAPTASDLPHLSTVLSDSPHGRLTDLGKALADVAKDQLDPPLRGVILITDGTQTVVPAEPNPVVVSRQMSQLNEPLIVVGVGPRGERSQFRDVAIESMRDDFVAFVKKDLRVPIVVGAHGMQNQSMRLTLTLRASGKPDQVLASREILAARPSESIPIELKIEAPEAGDYLLEAKLETDALEQIESNNTALSFVTVREDGVKILYLEGEPRSEQKFLKRAFDDAVEFEVDFRWIQQRYLKQWPADLSRAFDLSQYDAVVLGDLDASAISNNSARAILSHVNDGAGLLLLGGYHSFDAGGYNKSPLAPAFPIDMALPQHQRFGQAIDPFLHINSELPIRIAPLFHPITQLANEPENTALWSSLRPLQGANRLGKPKQLPGVSVLMSGPNNEPLLVTGQYGRGLVLAFAGDSTWRWCMDGHKIQHHQFWRQAMLWLLRRDTLKEGFRLSMEGRRLSIDDSPTIALEWFGGSDKKTVPTNLKIELSRDGKWLQNLTPTSTGDNSSVLRVTGLDSPGLYRVALAASGQDGTEYQTDVAFIVSDESRELQQPAADWQMLENMAAANAAAGGKVILPEEVGKALQWFRERQEATTVKTIEKRRLGDSAWDSWLYMAAFCFTLCCEWILRKRWQLP